MKLTEDERAGLSEDEIAAIESDDDDADALAAIAGEGDDDEAAEAAAAAAAATAAAAAEGDGANKGEKANEGEQATAEDDDDKRRSAHITPAVEDYDGKVKTLKAEKKEAWDKYNEGHMTADEYAVIEDRVGEDLRDLHHQQRTHESDVKRANASASQEWDWECKRFIRETKKTGVDYSTDEKLGTELDRQVKLLATAPENAAKTADWFLTEAHRRVKLIHGIADKAAAPSPPPAAAKRKTAAEIAAERAPDLSRVAPSIRNAPAAMDNAASDDEFAHLRNLSGLKYEQAIASMSADQLDHFMGS